RAVSPLVLVLPSDVVSPPPEPRNRLLPRPDLVQCTSIVQPAVLHYVLDRVRVLDVLERILVEHLKIRELPRLERPEILLVSDRLGAKDRRDAQHVVLRHPARRDVPDFPLRA